MAYSFFMEFFKMIFLNTVKQLRVVLSIFFLLSINISCQNIKRSAEPKPAIEEEVSIPEKPSVKIGLFISDAGVYTFSALSVLDFFEQKNVQFDLVTGSGWGAWIAGFYAKNQTTNELKWNLFKLERKGLFVKTGFFNKKSKKDILISNIKETFGSPLKTRFACPALNNNGERLWFREYQPVTALLNCLNLLPPLFLQLKPDSHQASLFSTQAALEYLRSQGMDIIVWIRPVFQLKGLDLKADYASIFWKELILNLNRQKENENIFIFSLPVFPYSLADFSKLDMIVKRSVPLSVHKKFSKLEEFLKKYRDKP